MASLHRDIQQIQLTNLSQGAINVTVTDGNGCSLSDSETITEPTAISGSMGATY